MNNIPEIPQLKYITSIDYSSNEWQNSNSAVDNHIQNFSYFLNYNIDFDVQEPPVSYYKVEYQNPENIKYLWLLYSIYSNFDNNNEIQVMIKIIFYNSQNLEIANNTKVITIEKQRHYYILQKSDFNNQPINGVKYIVFQIIPQINFVKEIFFSISAIGVNIKWFEPIIEQDEFVIMDKCRLLSEQPFDSFIYCGSFGWGDFGDTYFGRGAKYEL